MAQETDIDMDSIDYKLGHMSGIVLAHTVKTNLSDAAIMAEGIEAFENLKVGVSGTPLSHVLSRSLFLKGHLDGFHNHMEGIA